MRNSAGTKDKRDNKYDNDITKAIDSQNVTCPQYRHDQPIWRRDQPKSPKTSQTLASSSTRKPRKPVFNYVVQNQRTRTLRMDMKILQQFLRLADDDSQAYSPEVVAAMNERLALMRQEKHRRDVHDFAGGKMHRRGIYSLGSQNRVA